MKGPWLGVAALVCGLLAIVVPFLPVNMDTLRPYAALPFGLAGFVLGIVGGLGDRTGKPLALTGVFLSLFGLVLGFIMMANLMSTIMNNAVS